MRKYIISFIALILLLTINVGAESTEEIADISKVTSELSGDTLDVLEKMGVNSLDDSSKISFSGIINSVINSAKDKMGAPIKLFGLLVGIAVLTALYNLFCGDNDKSFSALTGMLCAGTISTTNVLEKVNGVSVMLNEGCAFINSFVPVMSAVTIASGHPVTSSAYNLMLLLSSNVAVYLTSGVFTTLLGCYLAVCLVSSLNSNLNLSGLSRGVKNITIWGIGIISTIFVGILSIQGIAGKAADSVALKTAKFALNSTIPIVGSALSDALVSVEGTIGILRTSVGTFGIVAGVAVILPTIISVVLTKLAIEASAIVAEMLGADKLSELYKNLGSVVTVLIALIMFFILVLLVSTTVILIICS